MMPYTDLHWQRFFREVGESELASDVRFTDIASRTRNIAELLELASDFIAGRTTAQWLAVCERLEIPAAPIARLAELTQDPHLSATGFFETLDDPTLGRLRFPGVPVRIDGERAAVSMPPRLGQHTRELLMQAGFSMESVEALLERGAAFAPQA